MSKYAGTQFSVFLVDGYNLIAALSETVSMGRESVTQQTNQFGATSEEHTPLNVEQGTLVVGAGFYDAVTNGLLGLYNSVRGLSRIVCAAIEGDIIGKHFVGYEGAYDQKYELLDQRDGLTKANMTFTVTGNINDGVIVQSLATYTADWDTKTGGAGAPDAPIDYIADPEQRVFGIASNSLANPTVVTMKTEHGAAIKHGLQNGQKVYFSGTNSTPTINGERVATVISDTTFSVPVNVTVAGTAGTFVRADTKNGGVGYLHVTAYSGFTGALCKIMHSPDGTTYAALITFTDLATTYTPRKERKTVTGTVDRYLCSLGDITGSGSITVWMGFCRN